MPALNWIDWLCLAVIGVSLLLGLWRGLIYEVFALMGWIAAFIIAQHYASTTQPVLAAHLPLQGWGQAAGVWVEAIVVGWLQVPLLRW